MIVRDLFLAAVNLIQDACSIQLLEAEAYLRLDEFPNGQEPIEIPRPPVTEILEFSYRDQSGSLVTLSESDYQFDGDSQPARLAPAPGKVWPVTQRNALNPVSVKFKCGGYEGHPWPPSAKRLAYYLTGYWYENRLQTGNAPSADPFYEQQLSLLRWI
ncbi:MAG TPA: hypothetical protein VNQ76_14190 [Planctomicrobium sp.]|nr:hypothetical protein [Planctomicrobium sp.]